MPPAPLFAVYLGGNAWSEPVTAALAISRFRFGDVTERDLRKQLAHLVAATTMIAVVPCRGDGESWEQRVKRTA